MADESLDDDHQVAPTVSTIGRLCRLSALQFVRTAVARALSIPHKLSHPDIPCGATQKQLRSISHPGRTCDSKPMSAASRFPPEVFIMLAELTATAERTEINDKPTKRKETARQSMTYT